MNRIGHLGAGLLIYAPAFAALLRVDSPVAGIIGLVIVLWTAPLPDIDLRLPGLTHRGPTHTVPSRSSSGLRGLSSAGWLASILRRLHCQHSLGLTS